MTNTAAVNDIKIDSRVTDGTLVGTVTDITDSGERVAVIWDGDKLGRVWYNTSYLQLAVATKESPTDRRIRAVGELVNHFLDPITWKLTEEARTATIHDAVNELRKLGRSEKWQTKLDYWQDMIALANNQASELKNREMLHWALLQGSVYANYGA